MPLNTIAIPPGLISTLRQAKHVVVFTGAGVSAESGIPTFRDALTGLWVRFDATDLATAEAFVEDPELVWGWYEWRRMKVLNAQPNPAHLAIARLASLVPKLTVITQNVDDLHERAGNTGVWHLHGSLHAPRCFDCSQAHTVSSGIPQEPEGGRRLKPPVCTHCGGLIRPGVVWFGEGMPQIPLEAAMHATEREACDVFFSIGASLAIYPAAELPFEASRQGACVIQINPSPTRLDEVATYNLPGAAGKNMPVLIRMAFGTVQPQ